MTAVETKWLRGLCPCTDARIYCATQPDLATAWAQCERGDWMLWLLGRVTTSKPWSDGRKPLVACALECASLAMPYVTDPALRGRIADCIADCAGIVLAWTRGSATMEEAIIAHDRLWNVAAGSAADAYASAADTVIVASCADLAFAAAATASAAAVIATSARDDVLRSAADIVRRHFPSPPSMERARG